MIVALLMCPFCIESYFDNTRFDAPLYVTALPFCLLAVVAAVTQFLKLRNEKDRSIRLFRGYDSKFKKCLSVFNLVTVFAYSVAIVVALYLLS